MRNESIANITIVEQLPTEIIIYCIIELLLALHITLANGLVLQAYIRHSSLRTITNTYIFSLAVADFLTGSVAIPLTVFSVLTEQPKNYTLCLLLHSTIVAMCTVSIFHLLAIAVDKYLSICNHSAWRHHLRHGRAGILLACAWIIGLGFGNLPIIFLRHTEHNFKHSCRFLDVFDLRFLVYGIFCITIVLPTFVILLCYHGIYRKMKRDSVRLRQNLSALELNRRVGQRRTIIRSLFTVAMTFIVCWYPLYIINTTLHFIPNSIPMMYILSAVLLSHCSAACNPIIYALGLPPFRQLLCPYLHTPKVETSRATQLMFTTSQSNTTGANRKRICSEIGLSTLDRRSVPQIQFNGCAHQRRSQYPLSPTSPSSGNTLSQTFSLQYPRSPSLLRRNSELTGDNHSKNIKCEKVIIEEHLRKTSSNPNLSLTEEHENNVEFFF